MQTDTIAKDYFAFVQSHRNKESITNLTATFPLLQDWVKAGANIVFGQRSAIVLQKDTENILRLFFFAENADAMHEAFALVPKTQRDVVCEVVGRDDRTGNAIAALSAAGGVLYAKFQRMILKPIVRETTLDLRQVEAACPEDAGEILEITHAAFDRITAHMHDAQQLRQMISAGEVLLVRRDERIAGFSIFDSTHGRVMLLDHVVTRPEYRGQKIARCILMKKFQATPKAESCILWINTNCHDPIAYHESNGFKADGTYCNIFTR